MTTYIAFLRAVNVGGTGKLPMAALRQLCEAAGMRAVRTYIASGNVVCESAAGEAEVRAAVEAQLQAYAGRPVGVHVRTAGDLAAVLAANPFPAAAPNHTVAIFLDAPPQPEILSGLRGQADEEVALGVREIYVHYGAGMGRSKLRIPGTVAGTARNMNTIAALCAMAGARAVSPAHR